MAAVGRRVRKRSEEHSEYGAVSRDGGNDEHGVLPVEHLEHVVSRRREHEAADTGAAHGNAGRQRATTLEVATHGDHGRQEHETDTET